MFRESLSPNAKNVFVAKLIARHSGKAMDVDAASTADGATISSGRIPEETTDNGI